MCMTRVIDGIPDHRDDVLSEAERASNGVILPCVSRAKSACSRWIYEAAAVALNIRAFARRPAAGRTPSHAGEIG